MVTGNLFAGFCQISVLPPEEENISQLMGYLTGLQGVQPTTGTSPIKYVCHRCLFKNIMSQIVIHQIVLHAHDWSKHVTRLNMLQLKLWNIQVISDISQFSNLHTMQIVFEEYKTR